MMWLLFKKLAANKYEKKTLRTSFWGDEKCSDLDSSNNAQLCECTKNHWIINSELWNKPHIKMIRPMKI